MIKIQLNTKKQRSPLILLIESRSSFTLMIRFSNIGLRVLGETTKRDMCFTLGMNNNLLITLISTSIKGVRKKFSKT